MCSRTWKKRDNGKLPINTCALNGVTLAKWTMCTDMNKPR